MAVSRKPLPNKVKSLREERGWTQEVLAAKLGTTAPQINRLEKGNRKLSVEWLLRLCGAFDVSADKVANIPLSKIDTTTADPAMLGLVIGWIIEACDKHKIKQNPKDIGKWASFVYSEVCDKDLNCTDARALARRIVKIGESKKR